MLLLYFCFGWFSNCLRHIAFRVVTIQWLEILFNRFLPESPPTNLKTPEVAAISASGYGKIKFINGSKQMVRVHLSPTVTWNHFERRSNDTLRTNPYRRIGFHRVPWVWHPCYNISIPIYFDCFLVRIESAIFITRYSMMMVVTVCKWWQWWIWIQILWFWMK